MSPSKELLWAKCDFGNLQMRPGSEVIVVFCNMCFKKFPISLKPSQKDE